jgi:hypothetical protein
MIIDNRTKASKIAARIINAAGRINRDIHVTISELAPECTRNTGTTPGAVGWKVVNEFPLLSNGRKDYIGYLMSTSAKRVYIRLSTIGGKSKVYIK